jgi:uncharacterized membrane protein
MEKPLEKTLLVLAIAGIIVSSYLVYHHYTVVASGLNAEWCDVNTDVNCDVVAASKYSEVYGIPVAIFGLLWFVIAATFPFTGKLLGNRAGKLLLAWSIFGLIGIGWLAYAELFLIKALCIACTLAHAFGIGVFIIALIGVRNYGKPEKS